MKIDSVSLKLPSKKISNSDILNMVEKHSQKTYVGNDLEKALSKIQGYLKYSGSKTRYWLGEGETPIQLMCDAVNSALEEADLDKNDIDVLVYTGIGRGFLEPACAYHCANALKMHSVECYDIIDACMSWTRAMQQLQSLFMAGEYKCALVVNAEFNMYEGSAIYPAVFNLKSLDSIEWTFPAFTIGEAATATIVSADDLDIENKWKFNFSSRPDLAEFCNIPIENYDGYCMPSEKIGKNGVGRFTSYGSSLLEYGKDTAVRVMEEMLPDNRNIKGIYTHASSKRDWDNMAKELNIERLLKPIYPETGNLVSASIPGAIAKSIENKTMMKGDKAMGWVGSAGMAFCAYSFTI